jgi:hypothetical protein
MSHLEINADLERLFMPMQTGLDYEVLFDTQLVGVI